VNGQPITPKICNSADIDYYTFTSNSTSTISVTVAATDTPLKVTLRAPSRRLSSNDRREQPGHADDEHQHAGSRRRRAFLFIRVEANGTVGSSGTYTSRRTSRSPRRRASIRRSIDCRGEGFSHLVGYRVVGYQLSVVALRA
jgi:hypothetical protein